jgi:hypothetical protein
MKHSLRDELLERLAADQDARRHFDAEQDEIAAEQCLQVDRANTAWLRGVIETHGWPGTALVGTDGANAAFLLAQHTPDEEFQKTCLRLVEAAVLSNDADPVHRAYLLDRVRVLEGRPQLYGTQGAPRPFGSTDPIVPSPIEDEEHVDTRRSALGLKPLREHFEELNRRVASGAVLRRE